MPKLYVIGIGPGDPELLTLKAKRILEEVDFLFFPKGREEGVSLARSIVEAKVDLSKKNIEELHFPMAKKGEWEHGPELREKWQIAANKILYRLNDGMDVAFLTLGDPGLYSTFFYLIPFLEQSSSNVEIEIVPGISSINVAFSKLKIPIVLGDESFAVLPATYAKDIANVIKQFSTVVLMKVNKVFNECRELMREIKDVDTYYVARLGMDGETVIEDLDLVGEEDLTYFSMLIIKRRKDA